MCSSQWHIFFAYFALGLYAPRISAHHVILGRTVAGLCKPRDEYGVPLEMALTQKSIYTATIACLIDATPASIIKNINYQMFLLALDCQWRNADTMALLNSIWPVKNKNGLLVDRACSRKSSVQVLQTLLKAWPDAGCIQDEFGNLPLHCACKRLARMRIWYAKSKFWWNNGQVLCR